VPLKERMPLVISTVLRVRPEGRSLASIMIALVPPGSKRLLLSGRPAESAMALWTTAIVL
jgi:hypothetical protein